MPKSYNILYLVFFSFLFSDCNEMTSGNRAERSELNDGVKMEWIESNFYLHQNLLVSADTSYADRFVIRITNNTDSIFTLTFNKENTKCSILLNGIQTETFGPFEVFRCSKIKCPPRKSVNLMLKSDITLVSPKRFSLTRYRKIINQIELSDSISLTTNGVNYSCKKSKDYYLSVDTLIGVSSFKNYLIEGSFEYD